MKRTICSPAAPAAVGPYCQAVEADGTLYVSGQLPLVPATGEMPATIEEQTAQSLKNIAAILASAGVGMDKVVKTTVFLRDMNDFAAMNGVYATFFDPANLPARSAVQVARLKLADDTRIVLKNGLKLIGVEAPEKM